MHDSIRCGSAHPCECESSGDEQQQQQQTSASPCKQQQQSMLCAGGQYFTLQTLNQRVHVADPTHAVCELHSAVAALRVRADVTAASILAQHQHMSASTVDSHFVRTD